MCRIVQISSDQTNIIKFTERVKDSGGKRLQRETRRKMEKKRLEFRYRREEEIKRRIKGIIKNIIVIQNGTDVK